MGRSFVLGPALLMFAAALADEAIVRVDLGQAERRMAGGIGASWHAIRKDLPGPRGSAWGANPPLDNAAAWQQLQHHAAWLGLDWLRVELDQRMYEPEAGQFDWDNEEMRTLYRILDWAETQRADVFLQQMWNHVAWNAIAGVDPLRSAPKSMAAFADGLATLADHLLNTRRYTCIKWLCINNEPGHEWSWWQGKDGPVPITEGLAVARAAFDHRGITLPLSGPDWTDLPALNPRQIDFDRFVGAYDLHSYQGMDATRQQVAAEWAKWAHDRGKPFFLSEIGDMRVGWQGSHPGPSSFKAALSVAETVVRGLAAGVDAFSRYSFVNRGDLDGQWQLVRTWDPEKKRHLKEVAIEPAAYYGFAILTRFAAKHSEVLKTEVRSPARRRQPPGILTAALRSPKGQLTLWLVNPTDAEHKAAVELSAVAAPIKLFRYQLTEAAVRGAAFKLAPSKELALSQDAPTFAETLPPHSITAVTTWPLAPADPGAIAE